MKRCWIITGKDLVGPISERSIAEQLAGGNQIIEIDNEAPLAAIPLVSKTKAKRIYIKDVEGKRRWKVVA